MKGYKTYACCTLGILATIIYALGYIDKETYLTISMVTGFGGIAALRSGVKKV